MYPFLGDADALKEIRDKHPNHSHCAWLRRDPNACEALPEITDMPADKVGKPCPHNVYISNPEVFQNREGVADTIERLFRLVNSSEVGVLSESELDTFTITELIVAKGELNRQDNERTKREHEKARLEAQSNNRGKELPSWKK